MFVFFYTETTCSHIKNKTCQLCLILEQAAFTCIFINFHLKTLFSDYILGLFYRLHNYTCTFNKNVLHH